MKVFAFLALIAIASAARLPRFQYQAEFDQWKADFNKKYESDLIELKRQLIWESNKNYVDNHNKNADILGFTLEMNEFADLETAEFKEMYNGLIPRSPDYVSTNVHPNNTIPNVATVDWRKKGAVTAIKNQGHCGSCWSFSTTGCLEGQYFLKTGRLLSFSEQQLVDCSTKYGNHGCKGGLMDNAYRYLEMYMDETEEAYPYKAEDGVCKYESSLGKVGDKKYMDIKRGDEDALMNAVQEIGPISVAIDAGHKSFQLYKEGVYYEPECSSIKLDHGVLAIGYGSELEKEYWLVKNSWGPVWGMEGYVMMSRNKENNCGIATQASYPVDIIS